MSHAGRDRSRSQGPGIRGYFRFARDDGLVPHDPAVYARLPKVRQDETRTQGLDRLELIRLLQVVPNLLGITRPTASKTAVRIEDYREML